MEYIYVLNNFDNKMSKYKPGGVAALFSKPKEPTTESGKKLEALFKQFHSKNRSFQPEESGSKLNNEPKGGKEDKRFFKKNKKRKFDESIDSEVISSSEQNSFPKKNKKRKLGDSADTDVTLNSKQYKTKFEDTGNLKLEFKSKKTEDSEKRDFSQKKNKASKFRPSNTYNNSENEAELVVISNNSPKAQKGKSVFIKKAKHKICDGNNYVDKSQSKKKVEESSDDELLKSEVKEFLKTNSKKSKKKNRKNNNFGESQNKKVEESSEDELLQSEVKEFLKTNSKKSKKKNRKNDNFEEVHKDSEKDSSFIADSPKKQDLQSTFKPKDKTQSSDFIRRPKKKNRTENNTFVGDDEKSDDVHNDETLDDDDTLFKSENEDFFEKDTKKSKKKSSSLNNFEKKLPGKSSRKKQPEFLKLLEEQPDDEKHLEKETDQMSRTLFIGNLPLDTQRKDLLSLFSTFGEIDHIRFKGIETDKARIYGANPSKSLSANYAADTIPGFIVFKERESAVKALSLCGTVFKNRHITVDFAMPAGSKKLYDEKRSIFIGNLPFGVQDESIWDGFSECGEIEGVRVVRDKQTGIGKGFGYVLFKTAESKKKALKLEDLTIEGRSIRIKAVGSNEKTNKNQQKPDATPVKRDTFKSRAIRFKMKKNKDASSNSRKSVKKLMKREKSIHKKKKIASFLQKSMK